MKRIISIDNAARLTRRSHLFGYTHCVLLEMALSTASGVQTAWAYIHHTPSRPPCDTDHAPWLVEYYANNPAHAPKPLGTLDEYQRRGQYGAPGGFLTAMVKHRGVFAVRRWLRRSTLGPIRWRYW